MACVVVWRIAAADVFGPFFHSMWPDQRFPTNPRLAMVSRILSLFRLSYPSVRESLDDKIRNHGSPGIVQHARNLKFLLSWLIPKVTPLNCPGNEIDLVGSACVLHSE